MKAIQQTYPPFQLAGIGKKSIVQQFLDWCKGQEENRILWLAIIVAGHGCVLTPVTVLSVVFTGNSIFLLMLAIAAMGMSLVTNLAAMPTRITLPVFALSLVIDLTILAMGIVNIV